MKYDVTYACGHTGIVNLVGSTGERERLLTWYSERLCPVCYREKQQQLDKERGLVLTVNLDPFHPAAPVVLIFVGDTKPHKEEIKALGGYRWDDLPPTGLFGLMSSKRPGKGWFRYCTPTELQVEVQKAQGIGAKLERKFSDADYCLLRESVAKYEKEKAAQQAKLNALTKPTPPEVISGKRWNGIIYGKSGRYTIYPDTVKTEITDEQAQQLEQYVKEEKEYHAEVAKIKEGGCSGE